MENNSNFSKTSESEDIVVYQHKENDLSIVGETEEVSGEFMYFVTLGNYRLSTMFLDAEDAIKDIERTDINRMMQICKVLCDINFKK